METHDDWSNSASVRAVIEGLNHPHLKVLWDCMHPQRMLGPPSQVLRCHPRCHWAEASTDWNQACCHTTETVEESFAAVGKHTRHVHAHDGSYDPATGKLADPPPPVLQTPRQILGRFPIENSFLIGGVIFFDNITLDLPYLHVQQYIHSEV
jgi:hypothetical protein